MHGGCDVVAFLEGEHEVFDVVVYCHEVCLVFGELVCQFFEYSFLEAHVVSQYGYIGGDVSYQSHCQ